MFITDYEKSDGQHHKYVTDSSEAAVPEVWLSRLCNAWLILPCVHLGWLFPTAKRIMYVVFSTSSTAEVLTQNYIDPGVSIDTGVHVAFIGRAELCRITFGDTNFAKPCLELNDINHLNYSNVRFRSSVCFQSRMLIVNISPFLTH